MRKSQLRLSVSADGARDTTAAGAGAGAATGAGADGGLGDARVDARDKALSEFGSSANYSAAFAHFIKVNH